MAYFPPGKEIVLFGGADLVADTWVFNRHGWREIHPTQSPPARGQSSMAYDPKLGEIVLYGGCTFCGGPSYHLVQDTWAFNGSNWHELSSTLVPTYEPSPLVDWDAATGTLDQLAPPPGYGPNPPNGIFDSNGSVPLGRWSWTTSGWTWDGAVASGPPLFIVVSSFVAEPGTTKMLYFSYQPNSSSCMLPPPGQSECGLDPTGLLYSQTWTWDGRTFVKNDPRRAPTSSQFLAADLRIHRVVAVAGTGVWVWNGTTWSEQASTPSPFSTPPIGAAYDSDLGELIVLGTATGHPLRTVTWAWDGSKWLSAAHN